jgi:hypothetical protein
VFPPFYTQTGQYLRCITSKKIFGAKILDPLVAVSIEKYSYLIIGSCQKLNLFYPYNFPNKILQKLKGAEFKFLSKV